MTTNQADYWATQETSARIPTEKPQSVVDWENNKDRWQDFLHEAHQPLMLEEKFQAKCPTAPGVFMYGQSGEMVFTQYTVTLIERCWTAWQEDGNPNAPVWNDLEDWNALQGEELEREQAKAQLVARTVRDFMLENNLPFLREQDAPEIYPPFYQGAED